MIIYYFDGVTVKVKETEIIITHNDNCNPFDIFWNIVTKYELWHIVEYHCQTIRGKKREINSIKKKLLNELEKNYTFLCCTSDRIIK